MTAIALQVRLARMLEEGHIKETDEVYWAGIVGGREIKLPVTGMEAGSQEFPFHTIEARTGTMAFGKVVP
jgi:hypothetical protein